MGFLNVLIVSLLLLELQPTLIALYPFAEMNNSGVPVEMVPVSETNSTLCALEALYFRVRDHVALQMRGPLEGLSAIFLFARIITRLSVPFPHVASEVGELPKELSADLAGLAAVLYFLSELTKS